MSDKYNMYNVNVDDVNLFVKYGPDVYKGVKDTTKYIEDGLMKYWEDSEGPDFEHLENSCKKILGDAFNEGLLEYKWGNIVMWREDGLIMYRYE